ncbi:4-alpha-glucanotransferase [Saccharospirillum impatiens]|uniref:4-alpha-glucanotransferase n=1 Tax=Saccharospirillum impatiens TaxID=169438 RepID=UPI00040452E6|nr:4-alpha-glucanotransferase [Saccharospirillum impatiens]
MANSELVSKLAHLRNISSTFQDYRGAKTQVEAANIERILSAMGYDLEDDAGLAQQAAQLDQQQWQQRLEPVVVINPLRGFGLNLYLSGAERDQGGTWRIDFEHSESPRQGRFEPAELEQTGDYWMNDTQYLRLEWLLPEDLPTGYHRISVTLGGRTDETSLIVTPATSFQPEAMARGDRIWGTAIQLYTLRSSSNWGMGDFGDLAELVDTLADQGADVIGLNPIHSLYPISPEHASPYSPSNRSYVNPLYVVIEQVPEFAAATELQRALSGIDMQAELTRLRDEPMVDYSGVSALKYRALNDLYQLFRRDHLGQGTDRDLAFQAFVEQQGAPLHEHATFEALLAHFRKQDPMAWGWPRWPDAYQDHHSDAVASFATEHDDDVTYYQYLQFVADEQLQAVDRQTKARGMRIGLYRDLAVGADRGGAEVWGNRESFCLNAAVGAPPDALGPNGQNWGLPPFDPIKLKAQGYDSFITLLRNNMRACGALRIDHAMSLLRLWWCPPGESAAYGAYVYYDLYDLLGILNLESQRNQCMVIAEDLGTVPDEVIETFPRAQLYSNKVFYFEMSDGVCTPPENYAERALAIVCNHDMPTVHAFWAMSDLDLRQQLGMFATEADFQGERQARANAKQAIIDALAAYKRLPEGVSADADQVPEMTLALCLAIHCHLAACRSQIVAVQLEDLMLINAPVNIPGTSDEYPNWRRKLTESLPTLFSKSEITTFCGQLNTLRGGG